MQQNQGNLSLFKFLANSKTCLLPYLKKIYCIPQLSPANWRRTLIWCNSIVFSVNILEVVLLTRVTRAARTTSTSADTVWGDFAPYRFSSRLSWSWPCILEPIVVGALQLFAVAVSELVLLHLAGKVEQLLLEVGGKCLRLSWRSINSTRSGICFGLILN